MIESGWQHFPPNRTFSSYLSSVFAHVDLTHMALNSYVLWSFAPMMIDRMFGVEQFWAFYLAGGAMSGLASTAAQAAVGKFSPSVGASGAICALIALLAASQPHLKVNLFFVFPMELWQGLGAMVLLDLLGLLGLLARLGIKVNIDHAAHLGGAAFGVWYALVGAKWWRERDRAAAALGGA